MKKELTNPEIDYFIVSLSHTEKTDKYFTLWRPDNAGYCYPLELAGLYKGYDDGYHKNSENIPVPVVALPKKFLIRDDGGRICIVNNKESVQFIMLYK